MLVTPATLIMSQQGLVKVTKVVIQWILPSLLYHGKLEDSHLLTTNESAGNGIVLLGSTLLAKSCHGKPS